MITLRDALSATPPNFRLPLLMQKAEGDRDNVFIDMVDAGNILICGSTGVGKSTLMHHMISTLLYAKSPQDLKMAILDGNGVEHGVYENLNDKFLIGHPQTGSIDNEKCEDVLDVIEWINSEMLRRIGIIRDVGVKSIYEFNEKIAIDDTQKLYDIVVFIDNYPALIEYDSNRFEADITTMGQLGKIAGVHFVCITNNLTDFGLPKYILNYTDTKIIFHLSDTNAYNRVSRFKKTDIPMGTGCYRVESNILAESPILYIEEIDKFFDLPDLVEEASVLGLLDSVCDYKNKIQTEVADSDNVIRGLMGEESLTEDISEATPAPTDTTGIQQFDEDSAPIEIKFDWDKWEKYKESAIGKDKIAQFDALLSENLNVEDALEIVKDFDDPFFKNSGEDSFKWFSEMIEFFDAKAGCLYTEMLKDTTDDEVDPVDFINMLFLILLTDAEENINNINDIPQARFKWLLQNLMPLSFALFKYMPDDYLPNLYILQFENLLKVADLSGITLPEMPKKSDYRSRCIYYVQMSYLLNGFAGENEIYDPAEVCAFFFDFIPSIQVAEKEDEDNFFGRSAWLLVGNKYEGEKDMESGLWQANSLTKKGDILFFYEKSPVKAMNSIWICRKDGIKDPFFWGYSYAYIGKCHENGDDSKPYIEIPKEQWITFEDFKKSEYFKNRSSKGNFVSKNFQDTSGWEISEEDYNEILRLFSEKGFDTSLIPSLD